jgi:hypothetical protein
MTAGRCWRPAQRCQACSARDFLNAVVNVTGIKSGAAYSPLEESPARLARAAPPLQSGNRVRRRAPQKTVGQRALPALRPAPECPRRRLLQAGGSGPRPLATQARQRGSDQLTEPRRSLST